jgi:hypothetical protein
MNWFVYLGQSYNLFRPLINKKLSPNKHSTIVSLYRQRPIGIDSEIFWLGYVSLEDAGNLLGPDTFALGIVKTVEPSWEQFAATRSGSKALILVILLDEKSR